MVNLATCFVLWWRGKNRVVYRLTPDTAAWLRTVSLNFIPEQPPSCWVNSTIVLESTNNTELIAGAWSIAAYHTSDLHGQLRYYFCYLMEDNAYSFSVYADIGVLNRKLIETGEFLAADILKEAEGKIFIEPATVEEQYKQLEIIKFVFAVSYYSNLPRERIIATQQAGPPARDERGKITKRHGRIVPLWTYQDLRYVPIPPVESRGPLDKEGLVLEPVIVRPYLRRKQTGEIIFIETHDSHRWKRMEERMGKKITV